MSVSTTLFNYLTDLMMNICMFVRRELQWSLIQLTETVFSKQISLLDQQEAEEVGLCPSLYEMSKITTSESPIIQLY